MHSQSTAGWEHTHVFLGEHHEQNERKVRLVIALTTAMMIAEIVGGSLFGSLALVADGWHMSTHAGALAISAFAYLYARRHKHDTRFAFGTGKLGDLAGFASAIVLAMIALLIIYEAALRLITPVPIIFGEAIAVAALGLTVNLVSAWLLHDEHHHHDHEPEAHDHDHVHAGHRHHDNNLRSAYLHVIADAATSVLAILGLLAGWIYGWVRMDAVAGIAGALVIANWSYTLLRDTGRVLLDTVPRGPLADTIRQRLEAAGDRIADLHLWQVGPGHFGAIISLVSHEPQPPAAYKAMLGGIEALSHVTVEVHTCH